MRKVEFRDAKAKLSAVVDDATRGIPSVITRHGKPAVVVLGFADWQRLSRVPSFGRLLMSAPLEASDLPDRKGRRKLLEAVRASGMAKASTRPSAARSQDYLYDKRGLPK